MSKQLAVTKLLADETTIAVLFLLRTQPLHCRKLSTILGKAESQIARKLSQLERVGILKGEWVYEDRNIKMYSLKTDRISIQITSEGIQTVYKPEKKQEFFFLESIFKIDIPEFERLIDREDQLKVLENSSFVVLTGIAGIGKTTLASFFAKKLRDEGKKIFWHTFSELDSVLFVVKKLAVFLSKYGHPQLLDYLKSDTTDMRVVEALLKDHMNTADIAFFFDDYHLIVDESMDHLFNQLKQASKGKICVISRYKPSFVSVLDNISEIRLEEMEAGAVRELLESKGILVDDETLLKVSERVGGHPLALELLCRASAQSDLEALVKEIPPFEIGAYLWDEIYSRLDPEEQQLLVALSIFRNPVNAKAIRLMCPSRNVRTVVRQLIKKSILRKVDNTYMHHAVTRTFCLKMVDEPEILHQKAAEFYLSQETSKDIMEALYHFLEAKSLERGAETILEHYENLINDGYQQQLLSFCQKLDTLPAYQYSIMEVEGEIHLLRGEYDRALHCFEIPLKESSGPVKASLYRKLGEVYQKKREYKTAEQHFLQGLAVLEKDTVEKGNILVDLAALYAALSEPDQALSCCGQALEQFSRVRYKKGIARAYDQMGKIYRFSDTEKALELLFSSLRISEDMGDLQEAASTCAAIGNVLYERGRTDEAATYFEKGLKISEQIGDIIGIAQFCNNIGVKYALEWKWPHAIEYFHQTLSISRKINDRMGMAFSYSNFGHAYSRMGVWEKAFECYFAGLKLSEELSDKRKTAFLYYKIGSAFLGMGSFQEAVQWIEKSLEIRERIGDTLGMAHCYEGMGKAYGELGEYGEALQFLEKALEIHEREKGAWMVAGVKVSSAQIHVNSKDFEKAVKLAEEAIGPLEEAKDIELLTQAHQMAAEAYLGLRNSEKAMHHAEACLQYACSMNSPKFEGRARRIVGAVLLNAGEYGRAEDELRLSMRLLKKHVYELAKTYIQFAALCKRKGQEQKYQVLLNKASDIFKDSRARIINS